MARTEPTIWISRSSPKDLYYDLVGPEVTLPQFVVEFDQGGFFRGGSLE